MRKPVCKYTDTPECPFDSSDQGPPFAGSVKSCEHFNHKYYCKYHNDMKNADAIYSKNIAALQKKRVEDSAVAFGARFRNIVSRIFS